MGRESYQVLFLSLYFHSVSLSYTLADTLAIVYLYVVPQLGTNVYHIDMMYRELEFVNLAQDQDCTMGSKVT